MYGKGNCEWHIIVEDKKLAELFERYIRHDRDDLEKEAEDDADLVLDVAAPRLPDLFVPLEALMADAGEADARHRCAAVLPRRRARSRAAAPDAGQLYRPHQEDARRRQAVDPYAVCYITYTDKPVDKEFTALLEMLAEMSNKPIWT